MSGVQVQLKKVVTVSADKIKSVTATTEGGVVMNVSGPVSVGDYSITEASGAASILSAADYAAAVLPATA
jgi:S-adenosylhomocysteine hydrolase